MGNDKPLVIGGGIIKIAGQYIGQVTNCYAARTVAKAEHTTNYGLEKTTDHILSIQTGYDIGFTWQYINPFNINAMLGMPGYSLVPDDRSLPGERKPIDLVTFGTGRLTHAESPRMQFDVDGRGIWVPLTYPVAAYSPTALSPGTLKVVNVDYTGGVPLGYMAICSQVRAAAGTPATTSLPSNIEFVPFSAVTDDLEFYWKPTDGGLAPGTGWAVGAKIAFLSAFVLRDATTGEFDFKSAFRAMVGTGVASDTTLEFIAIPAAESDGTYYFSEAHNSVVIRILKTRQIVGADTNGTQTDPGSATADGALIANIPVTVTYKDNSAPFGGADVTANWPGDFQYESVLGSKVGGGVKLTFGSTIPHGTICNVLYGYDSTKVRELPLAPLGRNPVVPITLDILMPNNLGKVIWHFFKAQINNDGRFAVNETDWMGVDMAIKTLDASDIYPRYGYGYVQLIGAITDLITPNGNNPFTFGNTEENQTHFA